MSNVNEETGEVIAVHDDRVTVKIKAGESCKKCRLCSRMSSNEMNLDAVPARAEGRNSLFIAPIGLSEPSFQLILFTPGQSEVAPNENWRHYHRDNRGPLHQ